MHHHFTETMLQAPVSIHQVTMEKTVKESISLHLQASAGRQGHLRGSSPLQSGGHNLLLGLKSEDDTDGNHSWPNIKMTLIYDMRTINGASCKLWDY